MPKTCSFVEIDGTSLVFIFAEIYGASSCPVIQIYDAYTNLYFFRNRRVRCFSNSRRLSVCIFSELFLYVCVLLFKFTPYFCRNLRLKSVYWYLNSWHIILLLLEICSVHNYVSCYRHLSGDIYLCITTEIHSLYQRVVIEFYSVCLYCNCISRCIFAVVVVVVVAENHVYLYVLLSKFRN